MLDLNLIGRRIKELRKERGLTQSAFAEEMHVCFQAVSNWERGITPPDLDNIIQIASYFGILVDELIRPAEQEYYIGVDGGGTKTEFVVVSAEGTVVKRLLLGGSNPNDIGYGESAALLTGALDKLISEFRYVKAVFLGIAGISTGDYRERLLSELGRRHPGVKIDVKNDSYNLLMQDDSAGMAIISGTGSVVFVRDGDSFKRLGGWGYLLDEAGSAYDIGREALRLALYEEDMKRKPSLLSKMLRKKLNTGTVWEHIKTVYSEGKPHIASLASLVFEAYERGDENAAKILDKTAKALAELVNGGVEIYGASPFALASGGLFEHYGATLIKMIERYSSVKIRICELPPVFGACRMAYMMCGSRAGEDFMKNYKASFGDKK